MSLIAVPLNQATPEPLSGLPGRMRLHLGACKTRPVLAVALTLCLVIPTATAQPTSAAEPTKPAAVVNGTPLDAALLELLVSASVAQGNRDTPELRASLRQELVAREVLAQEARRQGLDREPAIRTQLQLQQLTALAEALVARHLEKFKPTDAQLRAEYQRQIDALADAEELQISHIVTATEADARAVIRAARAGEPFDKLAREKSLHPSREKGGSLGWFLPAQIVPALANVVANMAVGAVTVNPVATPEGWQVLRLDARRKFAAPGFEDSRPQLVNALLNAERRDLLQKLLRAAKVQ